MKSTSIIWRGSPQFSLRKYVSYARPDSDEQSIGFNIDVLISVISVLFGISFLIQDPTRYWFVALALLIIMTMQLLYQWHQIRNKTYTLTKDKLVIDESTDSQRAISLSRIKNIYSINITKGLETVVLTYQDPEGNNKTSQLLQIPKNAELVKLINNCRKA